MCTKNVQPASTDILNYLADPAALHVLEELAGKNWVTMGKDDLEIYFKNDPSHPAKALLLTAAETGGLLGMIQMVVFCVFFGMAFLVSTLQPTLSPTIFIMWGALGVVLALLWRKHPQLLLKAQPDGKATQ